MKEIFNAKSSKDNTKTFELTVLSKKPQNN